MFSFLNIQCSIFCKISRSRFNYLCMYLFIFTVLCNQTCDLDHVNSFCTKGQIFFESLPLKIRHHANGFDLT